MLEATKKKLPMKKKKIPYLFALMLLIIPMISNAQASQRDSAIAARMQVVLDTLRRDKSAPQYVDRAVARLDSLRNAILYGAITPIVQTLASTPSSVVFTGQEGAASPSAQQLLVTNSAATGPINGVSASVTYTSASTGWLSASVGSVVTPSTVTLSPTTGSTPAGTHTATVTIAGTNVASIVIPVSFTLTPATSVTPVIAATPSAVSFNMTAAGASPSPQTVTITNGGGGSLASLSITSLTYGGAGSGWLSVALSGVSSSGGTLTLTPNASSLAVGTYTFAVTLSATGAANSIINGTLVVSPFVVATVALPDSLPQQPDAATQARLCTSTPLTGAALQAAINAADQTTHICLTQGITYSGNFTFPARSDTGFAMISTAIAGGDATVADTGVRITPTLASSGNLAKIQGLNIGNGFNFNANADGWYIRLVEITTIPTGTSGTGAIVNIGQGSESSMANLPTKIVLDRVYVHAFPGQQIQRCVAVNGKAMTIKNSWLDECHYKGADSQAIGGWNAWGPMWVYNNYLAGAGENVLMGGAQPSIANLVSCDLTFDRNHINTPVTWKTTYTKKNIFELKNACRVLLTRSVLGGSWVDGQVGFAFVLYSANPAGACLWCVVKDVTIRYNLIQHATQGFSLVGKSTHPVDSLMRRIVVDSNYVDSLSYGPYASPSGDQGQFMVLLTGVSDMYVRGNYFSAPQRFKQALGGMGAGQLTGTRITLKDNVWGPSQYGFFGCGGSGTIFNNCVISPDYSNNFLVSLPTGITWPAGVTLTSSFANARAANAGIDRSFIETKTAGVVVP